MQTARFSPKTTIFHFKLHLKICITYFGYNKKATKLLLQLLKGPKENATDMLLALQTCRDRLEVRR